jgi:hypothetical protein
MSSVAILRELLISYAPLTALVPAGRIIAGIIPQNTTLPAISIHEISSSEIETVARAGHTTTNKSRVQVTVVAKSLGAQKAIIKASKLGGGTHRGEVAGYNVMSVLPVGIGPDLNNLDDDGIYEQSRDFMVTFVEPN